MPLIVPIHPSNERYCIGQSNAASLHEDLAGVFHLAAALNQRPFSTSTGNLIEQGASYGVEIRLLTGYDDHWNPEGLMQAVYVDDVKSRERDTL